MKMYQFEQLIGILHILTSFFTTNIIITLMLLILGLIWLIISLFAFNWEMRSERIRFKLTISEDLRDSKRYYNIISRLSLIINLLCGKNKKLSTRVLEILKEEDSQTAEMFSMEKIFGKLKNKSIKESKEYEHGKGKKISKKHSNNK